MRVRRCLHLQRQGGGGGGCLAARQVFFQIGRQQLQNNTTLVQLQSTSVRGKTWPCLHGHIEASLEALTFSVAPVAHPPHNKQNLDGKATSESQGQEPGCFVTAILSWDVGGWLGVNWLGHHLLPSAMPLHLGWASSVVDSLRLIAGNVCPPSGNSVVSNANLHIHLRGQGSLRLFHCARCTHGKKGRLLRFNIHPVYKGLGEGSCEAMSCCTAGTSLGRTRSFSR
jgi:hypothetical protein